MLLHRKCMLWFIVFIAVFGVLLFNQPGLVLADTDIKITICDPDRPGTGEAQEGNTINTVLSFPTVSYGENRELGTVQITGKPDIAVPVQEGQKIMVKLPSGISYMQVPNANNYAKYIEWPTQMDGKQNQICDSGIEPGIGFVAATPSSLTVVVNNVDTSRNIMQINFVFNQDNYSKVRVAPFIEVAAKYSAERTGEISRLEFFTLFADITWPFSNSPVKFGDGEILPEEVFADVDNTESGIYKLVPLIESGFIKGYAGGLLKPRETITRAEAASLAGNVFGPAEPTCTSFKDPLPGWAEKGIYAAYDAGIVQGYPDGTFRPDAPLTRSEAIIILQKCLESYSR